MYITNDEYLKELFEREKEKLEEKELLGEEQNDYHDKFLAALELMIDLEETGP